MPKAWGSRNADLTEPEGVTPEFNEQKQQDDPSPKGGRVGKLNCYKMLLSCKTAKVKMFLDNVPLLI